MASQMETSATARYMNFSPQLVNERNRELNKCETKEGRSAIYRAYYFKLKDAYEKAHKTGESETEDDEEDEEYVVSEEEDEESEEDETEVGEEEDETDIDESEADEEPSEADGEDANEDDEEASEAEDEEEAEAEKEFGCDGCEYEWRDGWRKGWKAAMKHISKYAHKSRYATPPMCENCGFQHDLRKCGGCNTVRYCSTECQKEHWRSDHKYDCASMDVD